MKCGGCGNENAVHLRIVTWQGKLREMCDARKCGDIGLRIKKRKKTGYMAGGKLLEDNPAMFRQVRQQYDGTDNDEKMGIDTNL